MRDDSPIDGRSDADDELVVAAHNDRLRTRIHPMPSGGFRVELEELLDADDAGGIVRGTFWSTVTGDTSYTDDLELARQLAAEKLRPGLD